MVLLSVLEAVMHEASGEDALLSRTSGSSAMKERCSGQRYIIESVSQDFEMRCIRTSSRPSGTGLPPL